MSVVIRAGSGKGKGYLIQGIIAGIVIRKAEKSNHTPWNKIQRESKEKKKRNNTLRDRRQRKRDFINHRRLLGITLQ